MRQNNAFKLDGCYECPDFEHIPVEGCRCQKFNHNAMNEDILFQSCRLPELKEIRVWFEKRPEEANLLDVCVAKQSTMMSAWTGAGGMAWKVEIKNTKTTWVSIAEFSEKEQAEAFLGCKIPE